jgi:hypothetical protein
MMGKVQKSSNSPDYEYVTQILLVHLNYECETAWSVSLRVSVKTVVDFFNFKPSFSKIDVDGQDRV